MTIFFAILAAIFLVVAGVLLHLLLQERKFHNFTAAAAHHLRLDNRKKTLANDKLRQENENLRNTNRIANKYNSTAQAKLRGEIRAAQTHAQDMQHFHLINEFELQKELAGSHALIELLLEMAPPRSFQLTQTHEVKRLFRPVVEMDQYHPCNAH